MRILGIGTSDGVESYMNGKMMKCVDSNISSNRKGRVEKGKTMYTGNTLVFWSTLQSALVRRYMSLTLPLYPNPL